ncbi:MAG: heavy-metal-associated domain-containing protein [Nitrososphaerota archaeon]|nr:heavy-metal-associated domain-containing protein [Nitrososphaerota archaeon]
MSKSRIKRATIRISEMTCVCCVLRVKRVLSNIQGVYAVNVSS